MSLLTLRTRAIRIASAHAAAALLLPALAICLVGCGQRQQTPQPPPKQGPKETAKPKATSLPEGLGPLVEVTQRAPAFTWAQNNKTSMVAKAREFRGKAQTEIGAYTGVFLDFSGELYENGKLTTSMTARRVVADYATRTVTANGGVVFKSIDKSTVIKSEWARWYALQHKIVGNGGVTYSRNMGGNGILKGESAAFVADTALKTFEARSSAKGLLSK